MKTHAAIANELKSKTASVSESISVNVTKEDEKKYGQDCSGPQYILLNIDNAINTLKTYVENAKTRVNHVREIARENKKPTDSLISEYKQSVMGFFSFAEQSLKLTTEKINKVEEAIGHILVIKSDLSDCEEFNANNINDPAHPITAVLYYLFILINEHTEILKQVFHVLNTDKLGESLSHAINIVLAKPLEYAGQMNFGGELDKTLTILTHSMTLEYPVQASAAKKLVEDMMMKEAKETFIPQQIKRLDFYIKETSALLKNNSKEEKPSLTSSKLKIAINLRNQLKSLETNPIEETPEDEKYSEKKPDPTLIRAATLLLCAAEEHEKLTEAVIPNYISNYLGSSLGEWVNYFFSSLFIAASAHSYRGKLGCELKNTINHFDNEFPGILASMKLK